jgi:hypothetical protein
VTFSAAANPGSARSGTLTIAGETFTVSQAAAPPPACTYALSSTSTTVPFTGGNGTVGVSAGSGCNWTARSNDGWIDLTSGTNGSGNGSVAFTVRNHNGRGNRNGTITIAGLTFTVRQTGRP